MMPWFPQFYLAYELESNEMRVTFYGLLKRILQIFDISRWKNILTVILHEKEGN